MSWQMKINIYCVAILKKKNRVLRGCKNILSKGTREAEYSAFMATIIKDDIYYGKLKSILIELGIWNEILQELDAKVDEIKMQTIPDM